MHSASEFSHARVGIRHGLMVVVKHQSLREMKYTLDAQGYGHFGTRTLCVWITQFYVQIHHTCLYRVVHQMEPRLNEQL